MKEPESVVGIAWYQPEQYSIVLAMSIDPEGMAKTYEDWVANAIKTMKELREHGIDARRVDVDVRELLAWCEQRGWPLDGVARSTYAGERAQEGHFGEG